MGDIGKICLNKRKKGEKKVSHDNKEKIKGGSILNKKGYLEKNINKEEGDQDSKNVLNYYGNQREESDFRRNNFK